MAEELNSELYLAAEIFYAQAILLLKQLGEGYHLPGSHFDSGGADPIAKQLSQVWRALLGVKAKCDPERWAAGAVAGKNGDQLIFELQTLADRLAQSWH